jgi:BirA family biotin operon repressor/biotin-[acetyl-CoA-carboxylase] ligase
VTASRLISREEWFPTVGSTNDVVRGWLADGTPEVCVAVADEQTEGRGREGRSWTAPRGLALLVSLGFRPGYLAPHQTWRLAAVVSLAMADAAERLSGLAGGTIRLKWPNDLVLVPDARQATGVLKLAGVLGETDGLGTADPSAVVGIGINVDWAARDFPPELAAGMTSLREASGGRSIDRASLLATFVDHLEPRLVELQQGAFDASGWAARQVTTGAEVIVEASDGRTHTTTATGVDDDTGALVVRDGAAAHGRRAILSGEVRHVRVVTAVRPFAARV